MKKFLIMLLSVLFMLCCLSFIGCKKDNGVKIYKVKNGISFVLQQDNTLAVYKLSDKKAKSITIPASLDSKKVTYISSNAFYGAENLEKIVISHTIEKIGASAFEDCLKLSTVEFTTKEQGVDILGVKTIGAYAFKNTAVQSLNFYGVNNIQDNAFNGCVNLASLTNTNNIKEIGSYAFANCNSLQSIEFNYNGLSVGNYAFNNCINLKNATFTIVKNFGFAILQGCNSLQNLTITKISQDNNNHLGYFFGAPTYQYNQNYIPASLSKLTLIINTGLTEQSLYGCNSLKEIVITNSINMAKNTFNGCTNLQSLTMSSLFVEDEENGYYLKLADLFNSIPTSLTSFTLTKDEYLADNAFNNCVNLTNISLEKVNKIGKNAFAGCINLTNITAKSGEWKTTENSNFTNGVITDFSIKNLTTTYANNYWYI